MLPATPPPPVTVVDLDAGPAITIHGPSGTRTIQRFTAGMLVGYLPVILGDGTPGNYLDPGHYTITGPGGPDIGAFTAATDVPSTPFVWTNVLNTLPQTVDRSKDLTITWTGGVPGTLVQINGSNLVGPPLSGMFGIFRCYAPVSAGQITIPSFVLMGLPPGGTGGLGVLNSFMSTFTAPGLDVGVINSVTSYGVFPTYQ